MSGKRESAPEYKETVAFELFPTLEYDKAQKQRLIPFHALKNNIRRIINYAAHFDAPNRICMVYIVGEVAPEKIQSLLTAAECSDRVCVLTSAFPDDEIKFWREFDKLRDTLTKRGQWDDENQTVNAFWLELHEATRSFKEFYETERPDVEGQIGLPSLISSTMRDGLPASKRTCDGKRKRWRRYAAITRWRGRPRCTSAAGRSIAGTASRRRSATPTPEN